MAGIRGRLTRGEQSGDRRGLSNKPVDKRKTLLRLWRYLGRSRYLLLAAIFLSVAGSALALYGPKLSGIALDAVDLGAGKVDFSVVWRCAFWMVACYLLSALLTYLLRIAMAYLSRDVATHMRRDIFANMMRLPVGFYDKNQAGDIISILTYDVDTVNTTISADAVQILQSVVTVVVSFLMMLSIAPVLVLIFCVTVPLTFLFSKWYAGWTRKLFRARSQKLGALNGFVEEMLTAHTTTRAYGREEAVLREFDEKNDEAIKAFTTAEANGTMNGPIVNFISNLSLSFVCLFGAVLFYRQQVTLGNLSSFIQYSRKFSGPINEIANIFADLQSALAAAERVFALIDAEPEKEDAIDAIELETVFGDVQFQQVDFSYLPEKPIIKKLDIHASPGSLTAIVGHTGAGKTTIINLLMRFYDVDGGRILLDGKDIRDITRKSLRKAYSMVLQDTWLFNGTIFENIAYGKPDATQEEVEQAAKAAHIHGYISRLPEGYNTVLSDNGASISKGQKQLLTIARAMLLDAHMLILDEATSNVDTRTEQKIQDAMRQLMKGKTCFVIAHRLSTIRSADNILVLDQGEVVEQGTHESLMAQKGHYYKLYNAQFDSAG
ncbi:MAG: ABC transporter ATP-binding protein [Ruminococcaceae bacterium]|nr:ABC transporter ATP-binding protein [Oscillospiraceae bacterium]